MSSSLLVKCGSRCSASAVRLSRDTPRSAALPTCAFHEYCASQCRAAISRLSSRSRGSREDSKRQKAPRASTFSHSSGLRSQTRNGPRVPPRRLVIRSLISCWRGDRAVRAGSRISVRPSFAFRPRVGDTTLQRPAWRCPRLRGFDPALSCTLRLRVALAATRRAAGSLRSGALATSAGEARMTVIKAGAVKRLARGGGVQTIPLITRQSAAGVNKITSGISSYPAGTGAPLHRHTCDEHVTLLEGAGEV